MKKIKRTERGWAGHFICSDRCLYRRNTLLQYGKVYVVVSTVGNMVIDDKPDTIGAGGRMYETMAFMSDESDTLYHDADVEKQIYPPLETKWAINKLTRETDIEADEMHEAYVAAIEKMLVNKEIK